MPRQHRIALSLAEGIAFGFLEILAHHLFDQFLEADARHPAELFACLGRVAEQGFDFGGAEVARVDGDPADAGGGIIAFFVDALPVPAQAEADGLGGVGDEVAHRVLAAGGDDEVFGLLLLEHQPLHFDIVAGVAPVAFGVEVAQVLGASAQ